MKWLRLILFGEPIEPGAEHAEWHRAPWRCLRVPTLGPLRRRYHEGRWEYRRDEESEDDFDARQW